MLGCLLLVFAACTEKEKTADVVEEPVREEVAQTVTDSVQVDGVSGATNKANAATYNGVLMIPPQQHATVTLSMGGAIQSTSLLPGAYVHKGQVIATLRNPEFIRLQQDYLDASAQTAFLEKEYLRQQKLVQQEAASEKKFQQSEADYLSAKSRLEACAAELEILGVRATDLKKKGIQPYLEVLSPLDGYVTNMNLNVGKYFNVGEPVCDVINKQAPMLQLTAYEKDLEKLQTGAELEFRVNGMDGQVFEAVLVSVDQMVDSANRSIKVYARVKKADAQFRPGMYVSAKVRANQ